MSYHHDSDSSTRGVGAIAARDMSRAFRRLRGRQAMGLVNMNPYDALTIRTRTLPGGNPSNPGGPPGGGGGGGAPQPKARPPGATRVVSSGVGRPGGMVFVDPGTRTGGASVCLNRAGCPDPGSTFNGGTKPKPGAAPGQNTGARPPAQVIGSVTNPDGSTTVTYTDGTTATFPAGAAPSSITSTITAGGNSYDAGGAQPPSVMPDGEISSMLTTKVTVGQILPYVALGIGAYILLTR